MSGGLWLLKWSYEANLLGFNWLDPVLSMRYILSKENQDEDRQTELETCILSCKSKRLQVLVPGGKVKSGTMGSGHWSLLSMDFDEEGSLLEVRYRDSLSSQSQVSRNNAHLILSIFDAARQVPDRCNTSFQPAGSALCGWWVLAWCEAEAAEFIGEGWAAREWPDELIKKCKSRLQTFHSGLKGELKRLEADSKAAEEKAKK